MQSRLCFMFFIPCVIVLFTANFAYGQCATNVLVCPTQDGPFPIFFVSVATMDHHCLTDGSFEVTTDPPNVLLFENGLNSFFDVFTEVTADYYVRSIGVSPLVPPGIVFEIRTVVNYNDPWYPQQIVQEQGWWNPVTGRFEHYNPAPPGPGLVPGSMGPGQFDCFIVVHNVYYIGLVVPPGGDEPLIEVTPGCVPDDVCPDFECTPGGADHFRADVTYVSGQWVLEFEYSNPNIEPACYCVTYSNNLDLGYSTTPLGALDEEHQTFDLSINVAPPFMACGSYELFSYPPGAMLFGPIAGDWTSMPEPPRISIPVSAGLFQAGQEFRLVAFVDYGGMCPDEESEWAIEHVRVTAQHTLELADVGGECIAGGMDHVPSDMDFGESECFIVCHDVYYVQLNTPVNGMPHVSVMPGCSPPCIPPQPCTPGELQNCVYWTERIGSHWYLRFEYSNPTQEPRCYCVSYDGLTQQPIEPYLLTALDESTQMLRVNVWTSDPTMPVGGTIEVKKQSHQGNSTQGVVSFFDISYHVEFPVEPGDLLPGTAYQYVTSVDFDPPELPTTEYHEWVMVEPNGMLRMLDDVPPCLPIVPPLMSVGESQCFLVCHDIHEVIMAAPQGSGQPIINVVPGCEPPCTPPFACQPGAPTDYVYWFTYDGLQWILHFEYSNPFIEPVCYCVTYVGNELTLETHELVALDRERQTFVVSVSASDESGAVTPIDGFIVIRTEPEGGWVGEYVNSFFDVWLDWHTARPPVAPGAFAPGAVYNLVAEIHYTDPPLPVRVLMETVRVTPNEGLESIDTGGECMAGGGPAIPSILYLGQPECMIVCHDVYHVPIYLPGPGFPMVTVTPGCDPLQTNCVNPFCNPGGPWDYRYELFRVGGTWILEFEYSNPMIEPVCYCVEVESAIAVPVEPYLLTALDPARQMYDVTLWLSNPDYVASGILAIHASADPVTVLVPFAGVSTDYFHVGIPAGPGPLQPGQTFEMFAETHFDPQPDLFDTRSVEYAIVQPLGLVPWWDPSHPCIGDNVPPAMLPGQSQCLVVCHRVYDIVIAAPPSIDQPVINVVPGCLPPDCPPPIPCTPGGPSDYCYSIYSDGVDWHLLFEYSNPFVEPVCYCVTATVPPCSSVTNLTIRVRYTYDGLDRRIGKLCWSARQAGFYHIYATPLPNNSLPPPGPGWTEKAVLYTAGPDSMSWEEEILDDAYLNYVIICDCGPFGGSGVK